MSTQLTAEQDLEARAFLARRAGERLITSSAKDGVGVRRAHETINLSAMSDRQFLEFLMCRDTLNNSLSLMDKDEYMAIPASARQYADNLAFEKVIESNILNHKEDLDSLPHLTAQFVSNEIIKDLKAQGFTAKQPDGDGVTVGQIRIELTDMFRDHNMSDTVEESVERIKQSFKDSGLSFIKPENHQPEIKPEPEPEPDFENKPWIKQSATVDTPKNDNESFAVIPNNKANNTAVNSLVAASLSHTAEMPLDKRSAHLAEALAGIDVYYTSDIGIISSLPKAELMEESAANILAPLEEVEFNSSLDDNDPTFKKMAAKLAKAMREEGISPAIDKLSPKIADLDMSVDVPIQAKKVEETPTQVTQMTRRRY